MSSPSKRRFKLAELREKAGNKRGSVIELDLGEGNVFQIAPPGFWPDEAYEAQRAADGVAVARVLMGDEQYERFRTAGGRADDIALACEAYAEQQGSSVPESPASPA